MALILITLGDVVPILFPMQLYVDFLSIWGEHSNWRSLPPHTLPYCIQDADNKSNHAELKLLAVLSVITICDKHAITSGTNASAANPHGLLLGKGEAMACQMPPDSLPI